jgi:predicted DNA-binding transcriptional regulator AlpA
MQEQTTYLPASAVRVRYGGISDVTIWRWVRDPRVNFPAPIKANGRHRLWKLADLEAWEASRAEGGANASAA